MWNFTWKFSGNFISELWELYLGTLLGNFLGTLFRNFGNFIWELYLQISRKSFTKIILSSENFRETLKIDRVKI